MKRIILLSDGTGNAPGQVWRTNVWRTFESLDLSKPDQIALYGDGVGTSSFKPLALLGGVFGYGLKKNVIELYKFASRHYREKDEIFAFGFSRGAFTIRVLVGLIASEGLLIPRNDRGEPIDDRELDRQAEQAYRAYRAKRYSTVLKVEKPFRALRDMLFRIPSARKPAARTVHPPIRFLGLWDTVAAYGLPIEEMTIGVSRWIWPLEVPNRALSESVQKACHALSIDDDRTTFHPVLWNERGVEAIATVDNATASTYQERISQVWFAGAHANVGGGYPDDRLAYISLVWVLEEAEKCGLRFKSDPNRIGFFAQAADADGRQYYPRAGIGGTYRYAPRDIDKLCNDRIPTSAGPVEVTIGMPKIHHSVVDRIERDNDYAPLGLPARYALVGSDHGITRPCPEAETPPVETRRAEGQWLVWDKIWVRRVWYFAAVIAGFLLLIFPFVFDYDNAFEYMTKRRPISETVRLVDTMLPGLFKPWVTAFAKLPDLFFGLCALLAFFIWLGVRQERQVNKTMAALWDGALLPDNSTRSLIYRLRTSAPYQWVLRTLKWKIAPFVLAMLMLYAGVGIVSHLSFHAWDAYGRACTESPSGAATPLGRNENRIIEMPSSDPCFASRVLVREGATYKITIVTDRSWMDGGIQSKADGFNISDTRDWGTRVALLAGIPFRRVLMRRYWMPIARVGSTGVDEYFLDEDANTTGLGEGVSVSEQRIRVRRGGELFFYVNDAVLPLWPWRLYRNNQGTALITIHRQ